MSIVSSQVVLGQCTDTFTAYVTAITGIDDLINGSTERSVVAIDSDNLDSLNAGIVALTAIKTGLTETSFQPTPEINDVKADVVDPLTAIITEFEAIRFNRFGV